MRYPKKEYLSNGNLATIGLVVIFLTWVGFQVLDSTPPPTLDQVLYYVIGLWFGNKLLSKNKKEENNKQEIDTLKQEVERKADAD